MLRRSGETLVPEPDAEYREITVRLWGKGVVERGRVMGAEISGRRFVARAGQFVVSRIDARNGAMGLVPKTLEGALVTNDFPLFVLNEMRLLPTFLGWLCQTPGFVELCQRASEGTTNRVRLQEDRFYALEIPLPPLSEQRRVVARIEELAAQIDDARTLRHQAAKEVEALIACSTESVFATVAKRIGSGPLGEHVALQGGYAFKSEEYLETGLPIVRIANLENEKVHTEGSPCVAPNRIEEFRRFVLRPGDVLVAMTGATTGKLGIVPDSCKEWLLNQRVGRFIAKKPVELESKFVYWLARGVQKKIFESAYGGAQPNISAIDIEAMEFPFPPITEQRRIVAELNELQAGVDQLKRLQDETSKELDALLRSVLDKAFKGEL